MVVLKPLPFFVYNALSDVHESVNAIVSIILYFNF
jgi:hypothetical protein